MSRKVLIQRLQPLDMVWKQRHPRMKKIVYKYEGHFTLGEGIKGEQDLINEIFARYGEGMYTVLAWKVFAMRERDASTKKPVSKEKMFPFYRIAVIHINAEGRGTFVHNRTKRLFGKNAPMDNPFDMRIGRYG